MAEAVVKLQNFTYKQNRRLLFKRLNLQVNQMDCAIITGQNGSGKSILLDTLAGIKLVKLGNLTHRQDLKIGYMLQHFEMIEGLTPFDFLTALGQLAQFSGRNLNDRITHLAQAFGLEAYLQTPFERLSNGNLQKVNFVQAILQTPDLLILDEPLAYQDLKTQYEMIRWLKKYQQDGGTLVIATNDLFLIEQMYAKTYEISAMQLREVLLNTRQNNQSEIVRLHFSVGASTLALSERIQQLALAITAKNRYITMRVRVENVNEVVALMLKQRFNLKEVYDEIL